MCNHCVRYGEVKGVSKERECRLVCSWSMWEDILRHEATVTGFDWKESAARHGERMEDVFNEIAECANFEWKPLGAEENDNVIDAIATRLESVVLPGCGLRLYKWAGAVPL